MVVLPSSPVWYQSRGIDTSYDGILAFASRNLVFLLDLAKKQPEIYGILNGHTEKVTAVSFCPNTSHDELLKVASGAEDCIVKVWDVKQKLLLQEHSAHGTYKIISVHWSPVNPLLILSGDEKGFVVCWNLEKDTTDRFCPDGTSQMQLTCLTCSPICDNLVAIGYKSGAVSVIDISKDGKVVKKLRGHTNEVHAIVWSPYQSESVMESTSNSSLNNSDFVVNEDSRSRETIGIVATGSKDKTIKLWSLSKGKCIRTLKVPARPSKGRRVIEDSARLYLTLFWPPNSTSRLISSGYNGDIIVWNISSDADNTFEILASRAHDAGHQRIVFNISQGSAGSNSIVSTSMDRQLLHWTIPQEAISGCSGPDWRLPTLGGFVYSIAISPKDPTVVAVGVGDGMIRIWKTRNPRTAYDITTLWEGIKEKVMALAWHHQKDGCLAFATEDGKVGIYDTLSLRPPLIAETYHLKPVYSLSWGPKCSDKPEVQDTSKLNLYSCGGDGVILQHDPLKMSNDAVNIDNIISKTNSAHNPGRHSEVSWNQDGRMVAIGNDNGIINLYLSPNLLHIMEVKSHSKIVNCIRWKPAMCQNEDSSLQIASGSNNSVLYVHDLKMAFSEHHRAVENDRGNPILVSKPYRSLVGHLCRITGLAYNPSNPDQLVSSSYDGTAQVWDVESETQLHNFRGHHGRLMCVAWSPIPSDLNSQTQKGSGIIYSGGDDYTVHGWFAEDQQHKEPLKTLPDFGLGTKNKFQNKKRRKNKKSAQKQALGGCDHNDSNSQSLLTPDLECMLEKKKFELLNTTSYDCQSSEKLEGERKSPFTEVIQGHTLTKLNTPESKNLMLPKLPTTMTRSPDGLDETWDRRQNHTDGSLFNKKKKRLKNMFTQSVTLDNRKKAEQHQDCIKIARWQTENEEGRKNLSFTPGVGDDLHLGFYTDRSSAYRMMKTEAKEIQEDDTIEGNYNLSIWMSDIVGAVKEATERSQLTDQLVAMAPVAGQAFWHKTAYAFAKQLINEDLHIHAVHYLLVCDKVNEAIQILLEKRHYREAVVLARARLCEGDQLLQNTVKIWANKLRNGGTAELAAKCFASVGEFREAASCLAQRASSGVSTIADSDVSSLWAATSLCRIAKEHDLAKRFAHRAMSTVCLRTWNWKDTFEILSSFDNLHIYSFILMVHEILTTRLVSKAQVSELKTAKKSSWNITDVSSAEDAVNSFPIKLLELWTSNRRQSQLTTADNAGLDRESCIDIHTEASEDRSLSENLNEYRRIYEISLSLSAAIATSARLSSALEVGSSSSRVTKSDSLEMPSPLHGLVDGNEWVKHLLNALETSLYGKGHSTSRTEDILTIICEIICWATGETSTKDQSSSDHIVQSLKKLCSKKVKEQKISSDKEIVLVNETHFYEVRNNKEKVPRTDCVLFLLQHQHSENSLVQPYLKDFLQSKIDKSINYK